MEEWLSFDLSTVSSCLRRLLVSHSSIEFNLSPYGIVLPPTIPVRGMAQFCKIVGPKLASRVGLASTNLLLFLPFGGPRGPMQ
jgi:hypothetical protein